MSKRFVRNQKREMREQIEQLEQSIKMTNAIFDRVRRERDALRETVERTEQVLGQHFISLPVKTLEVKEILDRFQAIQLQPYNFFIHSRSNEMQAMVLESLHYLEMETHQSSLHVDELRGTIHMRYRSVSGDVAYSISDDAWRKLPEAHLIELLKQQIAPEMAQHLIRERKKRYL